MVRTGLKTNAQKNTATGSTKQKNKNENTKRNSGSRRVAIAGQHLLTGDLHFIPYLGGFNALNVEVDRHGRLLHLKPADTVAERSAEAVVSPVAVVAVIT